MDYSYGTSRDPFAPRSSYNQYAQPSGYKPSSYSYVSSQPPVYQPAAGSLSRVSHEREYHRSHESSRRRAESMLGNVPSPRQSRRDQEPSRHRSESMHVHFSDHQDSRRGHRDTADRRERMERTPPRHERSKSRHRTSGRDEDRGRDAHRHGHSHRTSSRPAPMLLEAPGDRRHHSSHRSRHPSPAILVPPQAPRITRLPTPDFDDDKRHCRHNVSSYQFCACCITGTRRGENAKGKMERQLTEARIYIAHERSSGRSGHSGRSGRH